MRAAHPFGCACGCTYAPSPEAEIARLTRERDAALIRAEKAERERDGLREQVTALRCAAGDIPACRQCKACRAIGLLQPAELADLAHGPDREFTAPTDPTEKE